TQQSCFVKQIPFAYDHETAMTILGYWLCRSTLRVVRPQAGDSPPQRCSWPSQWRRWERLRNKCSVCWNAVDIICLGYKQKAAEGGRRLDIATCGFQELP